MKLKILIPLLFLIQFSFAQQILTTEQINRLTDAGKVYGYIRYFHPWLQYKVMNWDSAFAANVEGIIRAKTKEEYGNVLQNLFSYLNDGLTTVANLNGEGRNYKERSLDQSINDSILYIYMNDAPFMTTDDKLSEALQKLNNVKGAIIDMRKPFNSRYYDMLGHGVYFDWTTSFFKGNYAMPSLRTVSYKGFPGEWGDGANNLTLKENVLGSTTGDAGKEVPLVFIVSKEDELPLIAIKLREKGKCKILQEGNRELIPGSSLYFYIADSILIQMRTGDAVDADGTLLILNSDATFKQGESDDLVLTKARTLLKNDKSRAPVQKWVHPMPIDQTSPYSNGKTYPSSGERMLAAAKIYTIIDHFYASKTGMTKSLDSAYKKAIVNFIGASDSIDYWKAIAQFHACIQDSHGFISKSDEGFSLRLNPIIQERGAFMPPVFTGLVENKIVITGIFNDSICKRIGIGKGDIVLSIDGKDPLFMMENVRKYQNAGNIGSQNFYLSSFILFGNKGEIIKLKVQDKKGSVREILMPTLGEFKGNWLQDKYVSGMFSQNHKPTIKFIEGDILYIDLTSGLKKSDIDTVYNWVKKAKGLIVDMRGYPQGAPFFMDNLFQDKIRKTKLAITYQLIANIPASSPHVISADRFGTNLPAEQFETEYRTNDKVFDLPIKIAILSNGSGQSNGDYIPFVYRNVYKATIIGTPTAGAMTNFTNYYIPGNIRLWLSRSVIDRRGIQPDIFVSPTIKGIQSGRDEVLERAIKYLNSGK